MQKTPPSQDLVPLTKQPKGGKTQKTPCPQELAAAGRILAASGVRPAFLSGCVLGPNMIVLRTKQGKQEGISCPGLERFNS